jgi:hypothetical protein
MERYIGEGMKMFRKYQLTVWLSIRKFYSHFKKETRINYLRTWLQTIT